MSTIEAYKSERKRLQGLVSRARKRGYKVPETVIPKIPERITEASVRNLQRITPKKFYSMISYVDPVSGVEVSGTRQRNRERIKSAEKGVKTRAINTTNRIVSEASFGEILQYKSRKDDEFISLLNKRLEAEKRGDFRKANKIQKDIEIVKAQTTILDSSWAVKEHKREIENRLASRDNYYDEDEDFSDEYEDFSEAYQRGYEAGLEEARKEQEKWISKPSTSSLKPNLKKWYEDLQDSSKRDKLPEKGDTILKAMEDALESWSPVANWTESLEDAKRDDKNRMQEVLNGAVRRDGREAVIARLEAADFDVLDALQSVLYDSGKEEGNFKDGRTNVNAKIIQLSKIIKGRPLTQKEAESLSDIYDDNEVNN